MNRNKMSDNQELFTDYALQIFSSFMAKDLSVMEVLLDSFKQDGMDTDYLFLPGVLYGMMYHFSVFLEGIAEVNNVKAEDIFREYAMCYATERSYLLDNPLLNINIVRENIEKMMADIKILKEIAENLKEDN